jgi:hypothetical protein
MSVIDWRGARGAVSPPALSVLSGKQATRTEFAVVFAGAVVSTSALCKENILLFFTAVC